jgi:glyoxylase-like metal-dependent hydrolase (beta-lactamase superfamily II)/8-oxo-dGTP pyrophosphatase MutT (NUDIX family)
MHDWYAFKDVEPRLAAAAIILQPDTSGRQEVLLARRNKRLPFMGGHHVFPGGSIDSADRPELVDDASDEAEARAIYAAAREVFEETGLLPVRGSLPSRERLRAARHCLLVKEFTFADILDEFGLRIDGALFTPAGVWLTPPFSPIRFLTRYFLFHHEGERYEEAESVEGEIVALDWMTPGEARRRWHHGEMRLSTPVAFVLHHLDRLSLDAALPWVRQVPGHDLEQPNRFELRRGLHLIPVRSATLPPATHTNCIIIGEDELVVIDPGAHDAAEIAHLASHLEHLRQLGGTVRAIALTHSHPDHTGGVAYLAERFGAEVWAHAETARQVGFPVHRHLTEGEVIEIAGDPGWRIRCRHTPGHDPGHLAFIEESTRTLLAGDLIANPGTILITEELEGDMSHYIESLERMTEENFNFMIPAHGMPFWGSDPKEALRDLISHRLAREARVLAAVEAGAETEDEVLVRAYDDTPEHLWPLAKHQLRAHLKRLGMSVRA